MIRCLVEVDILQLDVEPEAAPLACALDTAGSEVAHAILQSNAGVSISNFDILNVDFGAVSDGKSILTEQWFCAIIPFQCERRELNITRELINHKESSHRIGSPKIAER